MEFSFLLQLIATVASAWGAFSAYRTRDNERAAALSEIKNEVRHIMRRLDALEDASRRRVRVQREESA